MTYVSREERAIEIVIILDGIVVFVFLLFLCCYCCRRVLIVVALILSLSLPTNFRHHSARHAMCQKASALVRAAEGTICDLTVLGVGDSNRKLITATTLLIMNASTQLCHCACPHTPNLHMSICMPEYEAGALYVYLQQKFTAVYTYYTLTLLPLFIGFVCCFVNLLVSLFIILNTFFISYSTHSLSISLFILFALIFSAFLFLCQSGVFRS